MRRVGSRDSEDRCGFPGADDGTAEATQCLEGTEPKPQSMS